MSLKQSYEYSHQISITTFKADYQTHMSLRIQIRDSIKNQVSEIILETKQDERGLLNGIGC